LPQRFERRIDSTGIRIFGFDLLACRPWPNAQHERHSRLCSRCKGQTLVQRPAVISSQFRRVLALPPLDRNWICLGPVISQKAVAHTVVAVRLEAGSHVVKGPRLIEEVVFDDAVSVARPRGVQTHLQVLIVDLDVVERKLDIRKNTELAWLAARVFYSHIPQFSVSVDGNEQRLLRVNTVVLAGEFRIRQPVPALIFRSLQIFADRLPGDRPILAGLVVTKVNVMSRTIERHAILPETR